jgi:hypothetical protein
MWLLWIIVGPLLAAGLILWWAAFFRDRGDSGPRCGKCEYPAAESSEPDARCPECGSLLGEVGIIRGHPGTWGTLRRAWVWTIAAALLGVTTVATLNIALPPREYTDVTVTLTPKSAGYREVRLVWRVDAGGVADPAEVTLSTSAGSFSARSEVPGSAAARRELMTGLLRRGGVDVSSPAAKEAAEELAGILDAAAQGKRFVLVSKAHNQVGGSSVSSSERPTWLSLLMMFGWIVVWAVGMVRLVQRGDDL